MPPQSQPNSSSLDEQLIEELGSYAYDPLGFVLWAFPWGEPGTELAEASGPEPWQAEVLRQLGEGILSLQDVVRIARSSGHGIGKSALVAWVCWWAYSTFAGTRGIVTANTENQLRTKTWVEINKWHRLFIAKHLFKCTATAIFSVDEKRSREWRIDIVPWSENNPQAFAGLHNLGQRLLVIFDEASTIPPIIWETTEGALTDENTEIMWLVFGNPTSNTGRFRECFDDGKFAHRWLSGKIDSRSVSFTNKRQLQQWMEDFGEDSDFFKVRVRGEFPGVDSFSFIPRELALQATRNAVEPDPGAPVILGVDVARFGSDSTVIYPRQGRDARTRSPEIYSGLDTMQTAIRVQQAAYRHNASIVMIDGGGVGAGVVDRCRQLGLNVVEVQFGANPDGTNPEDSGILYANKRAEIWGALRQFLRYGAIPEHIPGLPHTLVEELTTPHYSFNKNDTCIVLERKTQIQQRGGISPNVADALACTFAVPYLPLSAYDSGPPTVIKDYNPFSEDPINDQLASSGPHTPGTFAAF